MTATTETLSAPEDALTRLRKENARLARYIRRLEAKIGLNEAAAATQASLNSARTLEQQKQEFYMRMLLDNSRHLILLLNTAGGIAYGTKMFLRLAGIVDFAKIDGRPLAAVLGEITDPNWSREFGEKMDEAFSRGLAFSVKAEIDFRRLGRRHYHVQFTSTLNAAGRVVGAIVLFNDVTEQNEALLTAEQTHHLKSEFLANLSRELSYCINEIGDIENHLFRLTKSTLEMSKIES
ncbi:MAG: PAS domain-containing protein [Planctomycetota bacterium]|jgi:PAS domain-containing protein|nr:PAS domain-containing protein [Planctomycetota bacterium]